jgi:hypothetical protein
MWKLTADPILSAADEPKDVTVEFEKGIPVKFTAQSTGTETDAAADKDLLSLSAKTRISHDKSEYL